MHYLRVAQLKIDHTLVSLFDYHIILLTTSFVKINNYICIKYNITLTSIELSFLNLSWNVNNNDTVFRKFHNYSIVPIQKSC